MDLQSPLHHVSALAHVPALHLLLGTTLTFENPHLHRQSTISLAMMNREVATHVADSRLPFLLPSQMAANMQNTLAIEKKGEGGE